MPSLIAAGKLDNAMKEMKRLKVDIMKISETRWPNNGTYHINRSTYYCGKHDSTLQHRNEVRIRIKDHIDTYVRSITEYSK